MRFRPNKRASSDHAPGPSIARPAATAETVMEGQKSVRLEERLSQSSRIAANPPATGVQKPTIRKSPAMAARNLDVVCSIGAVDGLANAS